jgi:hypothetical protein
MTTRHERTGATPGKGTTFGTRRRAQPKDTLMPDEPPKVLSVAIPAVAVLLVLLFITLRFVEYQDAVRVNLTLKTKESNGSAYGEAYLQQGEAAAVRADQVVDIDLYAGGERRSLQAKVGEITTFDVPSFYRVRVDLPPDLDVASLSGAAPGSIQVEAKILTQRKNLFDKLFGAFQSLSRNLR